MCNGIAAADSKLENDDRDAICNGSIAADSINKLEGDDRAAICNGIATTDSINQKMLCVHLLGIKFEMHLLELKSHADAAD